MAFFNGVATKYLDKYLVWFQVLESLQHQLNEATINDIKGNLIPIIKTYDKLRFDVLLSNKKVMQKIEMMHISIITRHK